MSGQRAAICLHHRGQPVGLDIRKYKGLVVDETIDGSIDARLLQVDWVVGRRVHIGMFVAGRMK